MTTHYKAKPSAPGRLQVGLADGSAPVYMTLVLISDDTERTMLQLVS